MGRKSIYSQEFKIKCVQDHIDGLPYSQIIKENGLSKNDLKMLRTWVTKYLRSGSSALESVSTKSNYSDDLKQMAVQDYLSNEASYLKIATKYGISSESVLRNWVLAHNIGLQTEETNMKRNEVEQKTLKRRKAKKFSLAQKEEAIKWCIDHDRNYHETADKYGCSYQQIYSWCSKAENKGIEALEDNRGKRKSQELLSSKELLLKENEQLKKENEMLRRQAELLKKLNLKGRW